MSHLPLDARAILEYLNELGYRNISAEQLKEFMKGMQRQSEISSSKGKPQQKPKGSSSSIFQKQQQSHQQHQKLQISAATSAARPSSPRQQKTPVKIIKSKKPLCHFKFYLDICDHQIAKKIEDRIKQLGGVLEFFLTPSVTHFITDKTVLPPTVGNNNNSLSSRPGTPQTPQTPTTPLTPYSHESNNAGNSTTPTTTISAVSNTPGGTRRAPIRHSRADAILNRARRGQSSTIASVASPVTVAVKSNELPPSVSVALKASPKTDSNSNQPYVVWQTEQALRFFAKVQHDLKDYLGGSSRERKSHSSKSSSAFGPTNLKGSFIKIESLKRNYRPYYQLFKKPIEWPKIELTREDGAFRLSPKKEIDFEDKKMTRKSRSRSSQRQQALPAAVQALKKTEVGIKSSTGLKAGSNAAGTCKQAKESSEKQCGVCEICKIEYDTLTIHLKTKDHEYFAKNSQNFIALDTLIHSSADVNKFLEEENKTTAPNNMDLEEMEVEETDANSETNTAQDPLEGGDISQAAENKSCAGDSEHNTSSPNLREKSKRINKGKHSSEKFQNQSGRANCKSPKMFALKSATSKKLMQYSSKASSNEELNAAEITVDTTSTIGAGSKSSTTRRKTSTATSVYSPPIRAMLPPSSMYKVVDTTHEPGTPARKLQGAEQAAASPSLIVKFKKVRQTEVCRLSGEADSFMFRKQRTSSELPTDLDRQTTSDHARASNSAASSTSLDSSANETLDLESEKTDRCIASAATAVAVTTPVLKKKAIAIAKRRKGVLTKTAQLTNQEDSTNITTPSEKQRFPSAPIQPEVQLKGSRSVKCTTTATSVTCVNSSGHRLTLPEATRKSSRTATAIVTAATTSSRLLRAAVEAAKKAAGSSERPMSSGLLNTTAAARMSELKSTKDSPEKSIIKYTRSSRLSVVKMEDRMGESGSYTDMNTENNRQRLRKRNVKVERKQVQKKRRNEDDDSDYDLDCYENKDDEEEDEFYDLDENNDDDEGDNDDDEDYVESCKSKAKHNKSSPRVPTTELRTTTREERAARRWNQRVNSFEIIDYSDELLESGCQTGLTTPRKRKKDSIISTPAAKSSQSVKKGPCRTQNGAKKVVVCSPPQRFFDIMKSERLSKLRYAFERLPAADLWCRVYNRQDQFEERYFEYYGSTNYRKLPYEMGPIPFDLTLNGKATQCTLCQTTGRTAATEANKANEQIQNAGDIKIKKEDEKQTVIQESVTKSENQTVSMSQPYTLKHKKLHLLQRYRQEQHQLLLQKQQQQNVDAQSEQNSNLHLNLKCDSKASSPEREAERERAGSTHSNTSSCSTATSNSKQKYRNKHLNKSAFLTLELPPRKSPREHASTLALVSCLIRQRQDSNSKPNSETDEPSTPAPISHFTSLPPIIEDRSENRKSPIKVEEPPTPLPNADIRSPRATRSAVVTPVEELRFATEISENVKRMRRGQNKYDHSPPVVLKSSRPARGKCKPNTATVSLLDRRSYKSRNAGKPTTAQTPTRNPIKQNQRRRPRSLLLPTGATGMRRMVGRPAGSTKCFGSLPSVRKTGSKKGVLEFEMDASALKALKASIAPKPSIRQLEWEIDKYLELAAKDCTFADVEDVLMSKSEELPMEMDSQKSTQLKTKKISTVSKSLSKSIVAAEFDVNTPPPTDCFSSDFDLYDLFTSTHGSGVGSEDDQLKDNKPVNFSLYSSVALQNYFRKRKSLKSNRTGWPKAQKKKTTLRHQHSLRKKIRFLQNGEDQISIGEAEQAVMKVETIDNDADNQNATNANRRNSRVGSCVITPPDSDAEDDQTVANVICDDDANDDEDAEFLDALDDNELNEAGADEGRIADEEIEEEVDDGDGETMADSIEIERCCAEDMEEGDVDADADAAAEADVEENAEEDEVDDEDGDDEDEGDDDDDDDDDDEPEAEVSTQIAEVNDADIDDETTTMDIEQRSSKRLRNSTETLSTNFIKHLSANALNPETIASGATSFTSTPSTTGTANMLRGLRRTPVLLNGSLGSCISPSEKAGDNSDIFTVSSDGLDTDLDVSNSHHPQYRTGDDDHHQQQQQQQHDAQCPHRTPKRKYDISKYAPNNKNTRTCAAEAATAAVKSLAISQFLKKEVRVTCRRLRPPFRRFRFRR